MSDVYARITGVGGYLPKRVVTNDELATVVDTNDEWIASRTGIRARHIAADDELASDMALPAARAAMAQAAVRGADLDAIIVATTTPDRVYPSTACLLQAKLRAAPCAAFDVQAVCSGFLYALTIADAMIRARQMRRILVVGAEVYSHILDWQDRSTCVLFGDGGGAAVVEASDAPGVVSAVLRADGRHADRLTVNAHVGRGRLAGDPYTRMDGAAVFRFAVENMAEAARAALGGEAADWLVLHQANRRIIDAVRRKLRVAAERTLMTVREQGNTSAASIPLALAAGAKRFERGDKILMAAVGGGFTWGACLLRW